MDDKNEAIIPFRPVAEPEAALPVEARETEVPVSATPEAPESPEKKEPVVREELWEDSSGSPVVARVRERLAASLDPDIQKELARLMTLRAGCSHTLGPGAVEQIDLALVSLVAPTPNVRFAVDIRKRVASELAARTNPLSPSALIRARTPSLQVVLGLILTCVGVVLVAFLHPLMVGADGSLLRLPLHLVVPVMLSGAMGSVVSILVRIQDFEAQRNTSPASMLMVGLFKPLVGMSFALFSFAVLEAGFIPLKIPEGDVPQHSLFIALSFLVGFSERLAQDIVSKMEDQLTQNEGAGPAPTAPMAPARAETREE